MKDISPIWPDIPEHLATMTPDHPVLYFKPHVLWETAQIFQTGFPGLVTYAVKANDTPAVIDTLAKAGITTFDAASPAEIAQVRAQVPQAVLHYNNPVRSRAEIAAGMAAGVASWSVDGLRELAKLADVLPKGTEIAVRLALPVTGAAYDFGGKFGEAPSGCVTLLRAVAEAGFIPAMTFHPGTQCTDPQAWRRYIEACADIAREAGVSLTRLNVGGGFPADRGTGAALAPIFDEIARATQDAFGANSPALVCEPGRAMVAESFSAALRIKGLRDCGGVFLNDGIYGLLSEAPVMGAPRRLRALSPEGQPRMGALHPRVLYGPTCDSLDRVPGTVGLPCDIQEEDYLIFDGIGAYSTATTTRFNGYGAYETITLGRAGHHHPQG